MQLTPKLLPNTHIQASEMLRSSQIQHHAHTPKTRVPSRHSLISKEPTILEIRKQVTNFSGLGTNSSNISRKETKAAASFHLSDLSDLLPTTSSSVTLKATVTAQKTLENIVSVLGGVGDTVADVLGKSLLLELVAADLDPKTGLEKERVQAYAHQVGADVSGVVKYEAEFKVPKEFGMVGAVVVENEHLNETFIKDIVIDQPDTKINITCNSFVHPKLVDDEKRIFFTNKSYLPSNTPPGLAKYRERELKILRGEFRNSEGDFKRFERVYDYDVYNDLGDPRFNPRPVLGGKEHPYPRRCKTNRNKTTQDPLSESRSVFVYVPRDENFDEVKSLTFSGKTLYSVLHAVVPNLEAAITDVNEHFPYFTSIDQLFNEGVHLPDSESGNVLTSILPRLVKTTSSVGNNVLQYETPEMIDRDKFAWFRDEEFARQALAGLHPSSIQLVTEWPMKSKLDPEVYGAPESAITKEIVEKEIRGYMTVEEAIEQKKLFVIDYHDLLLPYVNKVRELDGTMLYGSRTLFFLTPAGTLRPLAIELTRPQGLINGKQQEEWKQVLTPCWDATGTWLWRFAKAHVLAHDSGVHQLYSHWLRTHCATEPYIIATNRQLSAMHPIYRLLHPHFRYTMQINALARLALINADGIIETTFSPKNYSIQISSDAYDQMWRFDHEGLPADLINRGMAVEDPNSPHGLKLTIEDYPYACDGLVLWDSIKEWVSNYVNHYYTEASLVESDQELQAWWTEIRTEGHKDKEDEPWWPILKTPRDLIEIATTIIWVASGHHAAVNFGQYDFGGYFPNRPTIARTKMPNEDATEEEVKEFLKRPESALMQCFPSQFQATAVMAILDVLSNHSPDEEYMGDTEPFWEEDQIIKAAFEKFNERLKELEGIIDARNADKDLKNRTGAGVVPYQLFKPTSEPGVTGQGIPKSISI